MTDNVLFLRILIFLVIPASLVGIALFCRRFVKVVTVEDANIPGQIKDIIKSVVGENYINYKAVPIRFEDTGEEMVGDFFKEFILSILTARKVSITRQKEEGLLVFGDMKMIFVPTGYENKTKKLFPQPENATVITVDDLEKVKTNDSGTKVKFTFNNRKKTVFRVSKEFFFPTASATTEREEFAKFIDNFKGENDNLVIN